MFCLIQNEQRVLHDVAIAAIISIGKALGFDAEKTAQSVKVQWLRRDDKWMLGVDIGERVEGKTDAEVKEIIVDIGKNVRVMAAMQQKENAYTRYHG